MKKIFIVSAYSDQTSFGAKLVNTYLQESLANGHEVVLFNLAQSTFDPILHHGYKHDQALENELVVAQKNILWADHLVFCFPIWWGGAPAILKGFFDRTFLPGFAFNYTGKFLPKQLLKNKSARLIVTMDASVIFDNLVLRAAGINLIKKATLEFCGIKPVKVSKIGRARQLSQSQKNKILEQIRQIAKKAS